MPPVDDPLARLHGRVAFENAIRDFGGERTPASAPPWPRFAGKQFDLYALFEAIRALGGIQQVAERRQFALIRDFLLISPSAAGYAPFFRNTYERYCSYWFSNLVSALETAYSRINLAANSHRWFLDRTEYNRVHSAFPGALRDRAGAFKQSKSVDPEAQEEQRFLRFPETTQAVIRARLKENSLELAEISHPLFKSDEPHLVLLDLRNHIIRMWYRDTRTRLGILNALQDVPVRFRTLGCRIFTYLECTGVINFGAIPMISAVGSTTEKEPKRREVAIIGAGMAGLVAARQLRYFGFHVKIFEARKRPGGRVQTENEKFSVGVDMGAMIITGILQNPVAVLAHQTDSPMHFLDSECPLFDIDGTWVPKQTDVWAEREFNRVLDDTGRYRNKEGFAEKAKLLSLGEAFQMALEKRVRRRRARVKAAFCQNAREALNALRRTANRRLLDDDDDDYLEVSRKDSTAGTTLAGSNIKSTIQSPVQPKTVRPCSSLTNLETPRKRARLENPSHLRGQLHKPPQAVTVRNGHCEETRKAMDEKVACRLLRWHIANLEYGCASDISKVSLLHWDQDDPYGFSGEHVLLKQGYDPLIKGLVNGLDQVLNYETKVSAIEYSEKGGPVAVEIERSFGGKQRHVFDSILVTVPLGVLKRQMIKFKPALPRGKLDAINRLGFGGLMKVAMEFNKQFWVEHDMFGALRETVEKRGEFYFFWNLTPCTNRPILMTLVVEPCVKAMESLPDVEIVKGALSVLRRCYPDAPAPKSFSVSRWSSDEYAGGVYTNIPVGSSGADYDLIEAPIGQTLFFGGEHTSRQYPTTCASAIISGLREAYRIIESNDMTEQIAEMHLRCLKEGIACQQIGNRSRLS